MVSLVFCCECVTVLWGCLNCLLVDEGELLQANDVKLERLLRAWGQWGRREVRDQLAQKKVLVNGCEVTNPSFLVGPFDEVLLDDRIVQRRVARSLMLHKPLGVVSATKDDEHETVLDLIREDWAPQLHLAGRLDRFTTGLMVLTNDSELSERLTLPEQKMGKRYRVTCDEPISEQMVAAFEAGIWLEKEQVYTQSAKLGLISEKECYLTIFEGKHHQVKRMFARFDSKVVALHREAMGALELDSNLMPGQWRLLTEGELKGIRCS